MAVKALGYGTKLQVESDGEYLDIPSLKDFEVPFGAADKVDVTTHDSPEKSKEYISGLKDTDKFDVEVIFDPNNEVHQYLVALYESGDKVGWKVIYPEEVSCEFTFDGFVTTITPGAPVEDAIAAKVEIQISGPVTMIPGYTT
jgi:predicted secreted protein